MTEAATFVISVKTVILLFLCLSFVCLFSRAAAKFLLKVSPPPICPPFYAVLHDCRPVEASSA
jgi:hypothetical protein